MTGKITRLLHAKGYGFVEDEQGDVRFLHATNMKHEEDFIKLRQGQAVTFEPVLRPGRKLGDDLGCANVERAQ